MSKLAEIREAFKAASTECEWDVDGVSIVWKDGHPLLGTFRRIALTEALVSTNFKNPNCENDAKFIAKAPEYITYLLSLIEEKDKALEQFANEDNWMDIWDPTAECCKREWTHFGNPADIACNALKSTKEE